MAMDFSGRIGRVIDNPVEAQSAAMEEGHAWRVRHEPTTDGNIYFDQIFKLSKTSSSCRC